MVSGQAVWYYRVALGDDSRSVLYGFAELVEIIEGSPVTVRFKRPSTRQIEFEQISTVEDMVAMMRAHFPVAVAEQVVKRARVA